jgi:hypothetical protein
VLDSSAMHVLMRQRLNTSALRQAKDRRDAYKGQSFSISRRWPISVHLLVYCGNNYHSAQPRIRCQGRLEAGRQPRVVFSEFNALAISI